MGNLPLLATCTAERWLPQRGAPSPAPASARFRNPYREWIGAQIRADAFGYVSMGDRAGGRVRLARRLDQPHQERHLRRDAHGRHDRRRALVRRPGRARARRPLRNPQDQPPPPRHRGGLRLVSPGLSYDDAVAMIHDKWDEASATTGATRTPRGHLASPRCSGAMAISACRSAGRAALLRHHCNGRPSAPSSADARRQGPAREVDWETPQHPQDQPQSHETVEITKIARDTFDLHKKISRRAHLHANVRKTRVG